MTAIGRLPIVPVMWRSEERDHIRVVSWSVEPGVAGVDWPQLGRLLAAAPRASWVIDLAAVPLVTSEGLAEIMGGVRRLRDAGGRAAVCGLSPALRQVAASVRLDRLVAVHPDVATAVAGLDGPRA